MQKYGFSVEKNNADFKDFSLFFQSKVNLIRKLAGFKKRFDFVIQRLFCVPKLPEFKRSKKMV